MKRQISSIPLPLKTSRAALQYVMAMDKYHWFLRCQDPLYTVSLQQPLARY
jgi:hypothetical protein